MIEEALQKVKNKELVFGVGGGLLLILLAFVWVINPTERQIFLIRKDLTALKSKGPLLKSLAEHKKTIDKYKRLFPKSADTVKIIDDLNGLAVKSHMSVLSIAPGRAFKMGEAFEQVQVTIDAQGSFHELGKYISAIESLPYFIKVTSMDIVSSTDIDGTRTFSMPTDSLKQKITLVVAFFYYSGEAGV